MTDINPHITITKKISFVLVIIITSLIVLGLFTVGYFGYKKLTLSYDYCESFGELDSVIGWTLKKDIDSCLTLKNNITDEIFFDTTIYTDSKGFRTDKPGENLPSSVLAIGDSWTFGYGVNGDETYPYFLSKLLDKHVHNSGVPAYGSASNYLYAKSNIEKINPKTVIYLTQGMWRRSICMKPWVGYRSNTGDYNNYPLQPYLEQLIPCYRINPKNIKPKLEIPLPNSVENAAKDNVYPGGSLTAGYDSFWEYVFLIKPKLVIKDFKERFGLSSENKTSTFTEHYYIKKYELNSLLDLANKNNFQFVLIDPENDYKIIITNKDVVNTNNFIYISQDDFEKHVIEKSKGMLASDLTVPMDGHYGKGMNELIANLIYQKVFANKP